jgi:DNA-binding transcriptional LysR family regulator
MADTVISDGAKRGVMQRVTEDERLDGRTIRLDDQDLVNFASSSYLAEHGRPATPSDLGGHRLVRYISALHKVAGPRWLEEHRGAGVNSAQVDNTEVAANVVASGVGIGVVPCAVVEGRAELVRVFPEPVAYNTGYIVYHEAVRDMACVRSAVEALTEMFEEHQQLFSGHNS